MFCWLYYGEKIWISVRIYIFKEIVCNIFFGFDILNYVVNLYLVYMKFVWKIEEKIYNYNYFN